MSYNEDMAMEDSLYPWLGNDCVSDSETIDFDPEDDDEDWEEEKDDDED